MLYKSLIAALVAVPGLILAYNQFDSGEPVVPVIERIVEGPTSLAPGELGVYTTPGRTVDWVIVPPVEDFLVTVDQKLVVSFPQSGEYTIIGAGRKTGKLVVRVGMDNPPAPGPDNLPVSPLAKIAAGLGEARILVANTFDTVASEVESGSLTTPTQIMNRTSSLLLAVDLGDARPLLEGFIATKAKDFTSPAQYAVLWREIAKGVRGVNGP